MCVYGSQHIRNNTRAKNQGDIECIHATQVQQGHFRWATTCAKRSCSVSEAQIHMARGTWRNLAVIHMDVEGMKQRHQLVSPCIPSSLLAGMACVSPSYLFPHVVLILIMIVIAISYI